MQWIACFECHAGRSHRVGGWGLLLLAAAKLTVSCFNAAGRVNQVIMQSLCACALTRGGSTPDNQRIPSTADVASALPRLLPNYTPPCMGGIC